MIPSAKHTLQNTATEHQKYLVKQTYKKISLLILAAWNTNLKNKPGKPKSKSALLFLNTPVPIPSLSLPTDTAVNSPFTASLSDLPPPPFTSKPYTRDLPHP